MVTTSDEQSTPIIAEMMQWFIQEDMADFRQQLEEMAQTLQKASDPVRNKMLRDSEILVADDINTDLQIGAIDSATVPVALGEIASVICLAVHYRPNDEPRHIGNRKTGFNDESFRHLAGALRLHGELSLMAETNTIAIADNSWWSYLMDTNKLITAYENMKGSDESEQLRDLYKACVQPGNGLFLRAVMNPNIVAMSKTGSSKSTCKRYGYAEFFDAPISDLALFSNILEPGEYTKPRLLKESTDASFGVEKRGWSDADAKKIRDRYEGRNGLHVTFFKPWPYKKAYRIEFGYEAFGNIDDLQHLLAAIKRETQYHDIIEPVPQLFADRLAKQASSLAKMYGAINMPAYSEILFRTRT